MFILGPLGYDDDHFAVRSAARVAVRSAGCSAAPVAVRSAVRSAAALLKYLEVQRNASFVCIVMENLQTEILEEIFKNVPFEDINHCKKVCLRWRRILDKRRSRTQLETSKQKSPSSFIRFKRGLDWFASSRKDWSS